MFPDRRRPRLRRRCRGDVESLLAVRTCSPVQGPVPLGVHDAGIRAECEQEPNDLQMPFGHCCVQRNASVGILLVDIVACPHTFLKLGHLSALGKFDQSPVSHCPAVFSAQVRPEYTATPRCLTARISSLRSEGSRIATVSTARSSAARAPSALLIDLLERNLSSLQHEASLRPMRGEVPRKVAGQMSQFLALQGGQSK